MRFISNLSKNEYNAYVATHENGSFLQTSAWKEAGETENDYIGHYVGVKKDNQLVAVALILEYRDAKLTMAYIPRGPLWNENDPDVFNYFIEELKRYGKTLKVDFLRIEPPIINQELNQKNDVIKKNDATIIDDLVKNGFIHSGFYQGYRAVQPRYTYFLDLTQPYTSIKKQYKSDRRTAINRNEQLFHIEIEEKPLDSLDALLYQRQQLADEKQFKVKSEAYFRHLFNEMKDTHKAHYYEATVNIPMLINNLIKELNLIDEKKSKLEQSNNQKAENKIKELDNLRRAIDVVYQEVKQLQLEEPAIKELIVAVMINFVINHQVFNYILHSDKRLPSLKAPLIIHDYCIQEAQKEGAEIYDFFGIPGIVDSSDSYYGLYLFKKALVVK